MYFVTTFRRYNFVWILQNHHSSGFILRKGLLRCLNLARYRVNHLLSKFKIFRIPNRTSLYDFIWVHSFFCLFLVRFCSSMFCIMFYFSLYVSCNQITSSRRSRYIFFWSGQCTKKNQLINKLDDILNVYKQLAVSQKWHRCGSIHLIWIKKMWWFQEKRITINDVI